MGPAPRMRKGFTLLELLITLGVIALLVTVVALILRPAEIFRKTRDSRRLADLQTVRAATLFAEASRGSGFDLDGAHTNTCKGESSQAIYISIASGTAMHLAPTGWQWKQASPETLDRVDGSGWMPINFSVLGAQSPLFNLPLDPTNSTGSEHRFYYAYGCDRAADGFELNAKLESQAFGPGGEEDKSRYDGGDQPTVYEIGTFNILPSGIY